MQVNFVFLLITLKVLYKNRLQKARVMFKATITLLPLLGVTWIIGILAVNDGTQLFAWIFAIFNSLQVRISFMH